jgi:hypothetical protein
MWPWPGPFSPTRAIVWPGGMRRDIQGLGGQIPRLQKAHILQSTEIDYSGRSLLGQSAAKIGYRKDGVFAEEMMQAMQPWTSCRRFRKTCYSAEGLIPGAQSRTGIMAGLQKAQASEIFYHSPIKSSMPLSN